MLWLGIGVGLTLCVIAVLAGRLRRHPVDLDKLGAVSDDWIAQQRVNPLR